jgi:hypothetical protein
LSDAPDHLRLDLFAIVSFSCFSLSATAPSWIVLTREGRHGSQALELKFQQVVTFVTTGRHLMSFQPDPWQRAVQCAKAIRVTLDPARRKALRQLQDLWVALDHDKTFMTRMQLADEIESIDEIHAVFFGPDKSRLH